MCRVLPRISAQSGGWPTRADLAATSRTDQACRYVDGKAEDGDVEEETEYGLRKNDLAHRARHHGNIRGLCGDRDGVREVQEIPVVGARLVVGKPKCSALDWRSVVGPGIVKREES